MLETENLMDVEGSCPQNLANLVCACLRCCAYHTAPTVRGGLCAVCCERDPDERSAIACERRYLFGETKRAWRPRTTTELLRAALQLRENTLLCHAVVTAGRHLGCGGPWTTASITASAPGERPCVGTKLLFRHPLLVGPLFCQ